VTAKRTKHLIQMKACVFVKETALITWAVFLTLLTGYRYQCRSYNKLYKCLRTMLTLPCTVVSCERSFSKLRFVKSRLRSLIGQELLESLLLCSVESDLLKAIDNDTVYRKRSVKSPEFRKLLMYS